MNYRFRLAAPLLIAALAGCNAMDPYAARFATVSVGATQAALLAAMHDQPTHRSRLELPLVTIELFSWRTTSGRQYLAFVVKDYVVGKAIFV